VLTCKQQYAAWKQGPARPIGKKLTRALNAIQATADAEDIPELTSALKNAGRDADTLRRYPMPACADPHGYWDKSLARIKAAGDNAASSGGSAGCSWPRRRLRTSRAYRQSWKPSSRHAT
jgi:hypothetical protein